MEKYLDWLVFIYNCRGLEMTNEVWMKFKEFVESDPALCQRYPRFDELAGKQERKQ